MGSYRASLMKRWRWLGLVVIVGVGATVVVPLYHARERANLARAQHDAIVLASAISVYTAHMGSLPDALTDLLSKATNSQGQVAGPFVQTIPSGPPGWGSYVYAVNREKGLFQITNSGDGSSVRWPGGEFTADVPAAPGVVTSLKSSDKVRTKQQAVSEFGGVTSVEDKCNNLATRFAELGRDRQGAFDKCMAAHGGVK